MAEDDREDEPPPMTFADFREKWTTILERSRRGDDAPEASAPMTADEVRDQRRSARAFMGRPADGCRRCGYLRFRDGVCLDCGAERE